ncbi:hypothetical protein EF908_04820, partial [Streptomyces sp. WAC04770]
ARVGAVSGRLAAADAFVVVTPEYNHSFPAPLKNLIDWHHPAGPAQPLPLLPFGGRARGAPARRPVPGALGRRQRGPHWVLHPVATPSRNCD